MMPQHRVWLLALCLIGFFPLLTLKAQNLEWVRQLESDFYDESRSVSTDSLGNVYISGYTILGAGGSDAFVSKYDALGSLQWTRQLGTTGRVESYGVSADALGNVFISGTTEGSLGGPNAGYSDAFVSKYDASGSFHWTRQLGSAGRDWSTGVSADALGNVFISGTTEGSLGGPNAGHSYTDAFVSKYDASGNLQ